MPRDWKNDPTVIERHCTCFWATERMPSMGKPVDLNGDGRLWWRPVDHYDCPLHGDNPANDLPPEFP